MIELALVLLLSAIGAAERIFSSRRWEAERTRLIAVITAQDVSPSVAASVARAAAPGPKPEADEPRPVPIGL